MERSFAHIGLNSCLWEASICRIKTALRESFYRNICWLFVLGNLNRSERGLPRGEKSVGVAPVYSVKTALRESFDETHGGSLVFISEGNLNRSE